MKSVKVILIVILSNCFKFNHNGQATATVTINPSEIVQACVRDNLEFTCKITGPILEWHFPLIESGQRAFYGIQARDSAEAQKHQLIDNSTININVSRISAEGDPVSSRLLISPATESHNGTEVTCVDVDSSEMESTTIIIMNDKAAYLCEGNIIFTMARYSICKDPHEILTDKKLTVMGYNEPAVEGSTITIRCSHGMEFKNATCTVSGEWEPQLSCNSREITSSQETISISVVLGSTCFGAITAFIIITALVIFVIHLIKRNKRIRGSRGFNSNVPRSVTDDIEPHPTNNSSTPTIGVDGLVYADIGPSSFKCQSHQRPHMPVLDDDPIEYAQIKYNPKHTQKSSMPQKMHCQPPLRADICETEIKFDTADSPKLNINLDNLLIQLRPQVTPKWYQFGESAGIQKDVLDSFAKQCSPEDCIMEMLDYWLRKHVRQPTWTDVANILKLINLPQLASKLKRVHTTESDMDWTPQPLGSDSMIAESPPPVPPKASETSTAHLVFSAIDHSAPALPPKSKSVNRCDTTNR